MNIMLLTLIASIFAAKDSSKSARRTYLVTNSFNLFKINEFSVFISEKNLVYNIKSDLGFPRKLDIIDVSTNQIICRLKNVSDRHRLQNDANFTILNSTSNEWISGRIIRSISFLGAKYFIKWDGYNILMKTKFGSFLTTTFEYENYSSILAKSKKRISSLMGTAKYDLQIFSDDVPDMIYFIGVVIKDLDTTFRPNG
ncbi:unnamed protein product [Adineta steineri]|uniref:Uncharacterized protein n=1 Tax=Adineta steineri TaxID=433720 RepID=A0A814RFG6_9BILA|nr:unnamed protein product [Adineta steineri]CAF1361539.1 unnamed protein product [Adineta steineri]CAF1412438.1 unnamed protein product [Adineta steineri]CAF1600329.1 unnamed protein product [Adineta steineri]